ncbi:hypothetical protein Tco_0120811 [Tanacetum coccineum]
MVDVTNIILHTHKCYEEEDEITDEVFELRRRVKGKNVEESRTSPIPSPTRSPRNLSTLVSSNTEKLQELTVTHPTPSSGSSEPKFMPRTSSDKLADNLHDVMMEMLPSLVKEKATEQVKKEVPAQVRDQVLVYLAKGLILERKTTKEETERLISKAILKERGRMQAHISSQIQNEIDNAIPSLVDASVRIIIWVNKCIKQFNPYTRILFTENWKNPHAKIFYIRRQKEPGRPKEEIYSNSKIVQVIRHSGNWVMNISLSHSNARRANDCIVSITEPDYKNLNKNDIEDMYMLIMNNKVPDYANTGLLWSLSVFIRSSVIWERVHDFQLGIESYQQKINLTAPTITFLN